MVFDQKIMENNYANEIIKKNDKKQLKVEDNKEVKNEYELNFGIIYQKLHKYKYLSEHDINDKEIAKRRWIKKCLDRGSELGVFVVGITEGVTVLIFTLTSPIFLFFTLPKLVITLLAIIAGIAGFTTNVVLFAPYTKKTSRDFYFGKLFKNNQGKEVSNLEKILIALGAILSLCAIIALASVGYGTALALVAMTCTFPPLAIASAVMLTAVGGFYLFNAFWNTWREIVTEFRIKTISNFFKNRYGLLGYQEATGSDWIQHLLKCLLLSSLLGAAIAVSILGMIVLSALDHVSFIAILQSTFHFSTQLSNIISYIIIMGISNLLNQVFQGKNNIDFHLEIYHGILQAMAWVKFSLFDKPQPKLDKSNVNNLKSSASISTYAAVVNKVTVGSLLVFSVINGLGQGLGMVVPFTIELLKKMLFNIPTLAAILVATGSAAFDSICLNAGASLAMRKGLGTVNQPKETEATQVKGCKILKALIKTQANQKSREQEGNSQQLSATYSPSEIKKQNVAAANNLQASFFKAMKKSVKMPVNDVKEEVLSYAC